MGNISKKNCSPVILSIFAFTILLNFRIMKCNKHRIFFLSFFLFLSCFFLKPLSMVAILNQSSWPANWKFVGRNGHLGRSLSVDWLLFWALWLIVFILHYLYAQLPHLNKLRVAFFPYHEDPVIPLKVPHDFWWTTRFFLKLTLYFLVINKGKIWL